MQYLLALLPLLAGIATASPIRKRDTNVLISAQRDGLCLSLQGGPSTTPSDGTAVVSVSCDQASTWNIDRGSGSVTVYGNEGFALDAGSNPGNGGALKVWTSYPGLYQQTWYYTDDNRIAITGGDQCLDEADGGRAQTWQCTTGNTNQIWLDSAGGSSSGPTPSASPSPAPSSTPSQAPSGFLSDVPVGDTQADPPASSGQFLHPEGRPDLCVTAAANGNALSINYCFDGGAYDGTNYQLWDLPAVGATGMVVLHGTNTCMDAGSNPANGGEAKTWVCGDGWFQQQWSRSSDRLSLGNNQCLDITKESERYEMKPFGGLKSMQTWECASNVDPYQLFVTDD